MRATRRLARKLFKKIDVGGDGLVDFAEVRRLLEGKGRGSPRMWAKYKAEFDANDLDGNGQLDLAEFERLLQVIVEEDARQVAVAGADEAASNAATRGSDSSGPNV